MDPTKTPTHPARSLGPIHVIAAAATFLLLAIGLAGCEATDLEIDDDALAEGETDETSDASEPCPIDAGPDTFGDVGEPSDPCEGQPAEPCTAGQLWSTCALAGGATGAHECSPTGECYLGECEAIECCQLNALGWPQYADPIHPDDGGAPYCGPMEIDAVTGVSNTPCWLEPGESLAGNPDYDPNAPHACDGMPLADCHPGATEPCADGSVQTCGMFGTCWLDACEPQPLVWGKCFDDAGTSIPCCFDVTGAPLPCECFDDAGTPIPC